MRNYWLARHTLGKEIQAETEAFLEEIWHAYFERHEHDFRYLYNKYPRVRICARRALYAADSIKRNLRAQQRRANAKN